MMNRREALAALAIPISAGAPSLIAQAAAAREPARHVIDRLEVFRVRVNQRGDWVVLRTRTSSGLSGIGDCSQSGDDLKVLTLLEQYQRDLRGRSIFSVEELRQWSRPQIAAHGRPAVVAISAIEQSLWDLQGKALGVPTYELFGGKLRSGIRQYANVNRMTTDRTPAGFARSVEQAVADGFDAVKMAPFDGLVPSPAVERARQIRLAVECGQAARRVLGPSRDLLIDVHSLLTMPEGLDVLKEMEALKLYWLEEVTAAEPLGALATINRATTMTTAGGEAIVGIQAFYRYAAAGVVDVLMPDVKWCGGLLELRKVAAMAEGMNLRVSPHGPASPVGNIAAGHACVTLPNCEINEFAYAEVPWRRDLVDPPEAFDKGHLTLSARPGFGITLNENIIRQFTR
jgi:galactonate dehydratase